MTPLHLGFMVLINLIWGFALIAAKVSLEHFPPLLFAALRFTLIVLVLWMGIYPSTFLDVMAVSVENLIQNYETALAAGQATSVAVR